MLPINTRTSAAASTSTSASSAGDPTVHFESTSAPSHALSGVRRSDDTRPRPPSGQGSSLDSLLSALSLQNPAESGRLNRWQMELGRQAQASQETHPDFNVRPEIFARRVAFVGRMLNSIAHGDLSLESIARAAEGYDGNIGFHPHMVRQNLLHQMDRIRNGEGNLPAALYEASTFLFPTEGWRSPASEQQLRDAIDMLTGMNDKDLSASAVPVFNEVLIALRDIGEAQGFVEDKFLKQALAKSGGSAEQLIVELRIVEMARLAEA